MNFKVSEAEEEVNYDYDYSYATKGKSNIRSNYDDYDDESEEFEDSEDMNPKLKKSINSPKKLSNIPKEPSVVQASLGSINSNESALEKAQQMLNKYSNKSFSNKANDHKIRKFDEDNLSIESDDEDNYSEFEESGNSNDIKVILVNLLEPQLLN